MKRNIKTALIVLFTFAAIFGLVYLLVCDLPLNDLMIIAGVLLSILFIMIIAVLCLLYVFQRDKEMDIRRDSDHD